MFDLIIRNGTIIDGTRADRYPADIGLRADRIAAIGDLGDAESQHSIDAQGKIVAPGFVDVHNHSDGWLLQKPNFLPKTLQGFTTEVLMADGISYAPVDATTRAHWLYYMRALNGLMQSHYSGWESLADYMQLLDGHTAQNTITHLPYAHLRAMACGWDRRIPDDVQNGRDSRRSRTRHGRRRGRHFNRPRLHRRMLCHHRRTRRSLHCHGGPTGHLRHPRAL